MSFVNERSEIPGESRTIDYERGAILKRSDLEHLSKAPRSSDRGFIILWKEKIELVVVPQNELFEEDGSRGRVTYYVRKCYYPEELRPFKKEIIQMVIEGLTTYGVSYGSREGTETVVKIDLDLGNLQMEPLHEMPKSPEISTNIN